MHQKNRSACSVLQRSTGTPETTWKPRPRSSSVRQRAISSSSVGSGKSSADSSPVGLPVSAAAARAASISSIAAASRRRRQSSRLAMSSPRHAAADGFAASRGSVCGRAK